MKTCSDLVILDERNVCFSKTLKCDGSNNLY